MAIIYSSSAGFSKDYASYRLLDGGFAIKFNTLDGLLASEVSRFGQGTLWEAEIYRYREASTFASDHHVTTAGGVKLYVIPVYGTNVPIFPLRAFGAAEDGIRDDTAEWQTALKTVQNVGGLLLNGMSRVTKVTYIQTWEHDMMLIGNNRDQDGIYMSSSDVATLKGIAKTPFDLRMENVHLKGAWADDPKESGEECWLVDVFNISSLITVNCKFSSSQKGLVKARASERAESWYCHYEESTRDGWNVTGSKNTKFIGNTVIHVRNDAVGLHVNSGSTDPTIGQHIISENYFQDCQGVAAMGARNLIVSNNVGNLMRTRFCVVGVDTTFGEGLLSPFNITIENNVVQDLLDYKLFEGGSNTNHFYTYIYPMTPSEVGATGTIPGEARSRGAASSLCMAASTASEPEAASHRGWVSLYAVTSSCAPAPAALPI
tara:strand:+ start:6100 stop:7395 length:1296 start_codon:yes stop_codon:yes gene_type:complete